MMDQGSVRNLEQIQETDEQPQLYFSHQFKVGNAYALAREVRRGLERMNVVIH